MTASATPADVKVVFRIANGDGTTETEVLWATDLGGDQFRLQGSPLWAYGVSWQDVVSAPFSQEEGLPTFRQVVAKSGNRTVRVVLEPLLAPGNESDQLVQGLLALGCSYQGQGRRYLSINVPPGVELQAVRDYLIELDAIWEHADPTYASLFPVDA